MRSSKSRSRGKPNRNVNRSPANNINRVFDSSGPEGKVRGTPQQIIDKYSQLARDASLSNDRVAAESFRQHAEHYTRMLAEAQRDAEEKRLQLEQQNRDRQAQQQKQRERDDQRRDDQQSGGPQGGQGRNPGQARPEDRGNDPAAAPQPDLVDVIGEDAGNSGLVETPETAPKKPPRSRKPRSPKPKPDAAEAKAGGGEPEAAE